MSAVSLPTTVAAAAGPQDQEKTGLGNYFIANYPPFSHWSPAYLPAAEAALDTAPKAGTPLGLYLHIPFCRKRCKFCYFRVYTDKNARDVEGYLSGLLKELEFYGQRAAAMDRPLDFVYFGGGTPSYLSTSQLTHLFDGIRRRLRWDHPREVTFECEPGTLQREKLVALKEQGVTRLSLGVENFSDALLEENGRAHRSGEIFKAYGWMKELGFDQVNIDLIAGMVGETEENWRECVRKTIALRPDSVTIYQMELPFNTVYSKEVALGAGAAPAIADWPTKRRWAAMAYDELAAAGYEVSSGYTMVLKDKKAPFVYRDCLWRGADLLGTGVASFGHVAGVHMQNVDQWEDYLRLLLQERRLPLNRAYRLPDDEALIREMILQMKTGLLAAPYFRGKFGVDILERFGSVWRSLEQEGLIESAKDGIRLTRIGLFQVDRLLPRFFKPEHRSTRYT